MEKKKYLIIFLIINIFIGASIQERKLIFVYEHARHGARGPSSSYNSIFSNGRDEYNISWEFDGELSQIGKRQHYYLGVRNRIKYGNGKLINTDKYNPMELLIHATDYNRTHQSIYSELMGMFAHSKEEPLKDTEINYNLTNKYYLEKYDNETKKKIDEEIKKLGNEVNAGSIPIFNIHDFPPNRIFLVDYCTKIDNYRDEQVGKLVRDLYKEFNEKYAKIFGTFIGPGNFTDFDKMKSITDHFICDYDGKKDFGNLKNLINLDEFYDFARRFYGTFIFHWFIDGYTSGLEETHLMQDLIGYMDRRIKYENVTTYKAPKMVMDCGHDTTVGPIARYMNATFNVPYHTFCDFACNVYYELYSYGNGTYSVDYYLDDELLIKDMNYKEFKKTMESHYWNDSYVDEFCGRDSDTNIIREDRVKKYSNLLLGTTIISTSLFLIFATSTFVIFKRLKKLERKILENPLLNQEMEGTELPGMEE